MTTALAPHLAPNSASPVPWRAYAALAASMTLVGVYVALSRPLTTAMPVFLLAFLRFAIAALAMLPWSLARADEAPLAGRDRWRFFLMSLFGNFLFSICMLYGVSMTTATAAGVILSTLPAVVAVFSRLFLREPLSARALLALAFAVGGISALHLGPSLWAAADATASQQTAPITERAWAGSLLVFGAVCCEALYVIFGKRLAGKRSALRVSATINLWGLALMTPLGFWQAAQFDFGAVAVATWLLLVFYALASSLFAVWLWMRGLAHVPAHHAGVFTAALPIAATVVGVAFLGESFHWVEAVALTGALAGIALIATAPAAPRG